MTIILATILAFITPKVFVDPQILSSIQQNGSADILCILKTSNKDLHSITKSFETKNKMGDFVFNTLKKEADNSQVKLKWYLNSKKIEFSSFYIVNALHIPSASAELVNYLSLQPEVERLEYNATYKLQRPFIESDDLNKLKLRSPLATGWGILKIKADSLWALGFKGKGAVIGGEDTGVELVSLLKANYRGTLENGYNHNYNWHDAIHSLNPLNNDANQNEFNNPCGLDTLAPCDDDNHGTHTMGTMNAEGFEIGVAPEAKWMACRCMERGWGSPASYMECFEFFLAPTDLTNSNPDPHKAPHVINNSWGCPKEEGCDTSNFKTMEQVVKNLKAAGIFVTVSAGNSGATGCGTINEPAAIFESSFSVGATNIGDSIAGFSSKGPVTIDGSNRLKPNISAPGVGVISVVKNGSLASFSGTSMAGPHVCGAVALLISALPQLAGKVDLIEQILEQTAEPKTVKILCGLDQSSSVPNNTYGFGRLDVYKAYLLAKQIISTGNSNLPSISRLIVYPNPSPGNYLFELKGTDIISSINVYDANGHLILVKRNLSDSLIQITLKTIPGIYYYNVISNKATFSGKLIEY